MPQISRYTNFIFNLPSISSSMGHIAGINLINSTLDAQLPYTRLLICNNTERILSMYVNICMHLPYIALHVHFIHVNTVRLQTNFCIQTNGYQQYSETGLINVPHLNVVLLMLCHTICQALDNVNFTNPFVVTFN